VKKSAARTEAVLRLYYVLRFTFYAPRSDLMPKTHLTIGSRGSKLALWQSEMIKERISKLHPGLTVSIKVIKTTGDKITDAPLTEFGGKGLFIKEIEEALLAGEIDLAVHSLKDMTTEVPAGLWIATVTEREDPRDALITRDGRGSLMELPRHAVVGTSSLRRSVQLKTVRPDLEIRMLRGNVDTRLRKLDDGQYDAIILASAGLIRLGLADRITERISTDVIIPAIGQGAIAVETREQAREVNEIVARLDHTPTRTAITAERAFLKRLEGSCQVPMAAHAKIIEAELTLHGMVASPDGSRMLKDQVSGPTVEAAQLGLHLAERLIEVGAIELLKGTGSELEHG
jgi:hydroxymethylbilane synthase